jgi:hypothetical protein
MKNKLLRISLYGSLALMLVSGSSCKKDFVNPGAATDAQVFSSPQGLTGVAVGLQRVYTAGRGSSLYNRISIDGLVTNQLLVLNQGNTSEYQLQLGAGSVDGTNTMLGGLWTTSNKIVYDADKIIAGAEALGDKAYASGLIGYASIFKAMALADLSMFWEKVPASIGTNVTFEDRVAGYTKAIAAIDKGITTVTTTAIAPSFLANIPAGIDILNTLYALKARYSLFIGNYAQALTAANAVNLAAKSTFNFTSVNLNPIFETSTSTNNVYAVTDPNVMGLPAGLQPDAADKRIPFYTTTAYASKILGFAGTSTGSWPVYLPGEITLIKAEAYARQTTPDLVNALIELNKVVTKKAAADPFGVGADLPPVVAVTQQQVLDQIYKHRSIELFMSGLRLEDMRRFARPNAERRRNFLPYPFLERDNNVNTPADPVF